MPRAAAATHYSTARVHAASCRRARRPGPRRQPARGASAGGGRAWYVRSKPLHGRHQVSDASSTMSRGACCSSARSNCSSLVNTLTSPGRHCRARACQGATAAPQAMPCSASGRACNHHIGVSSQEKPEGKTMMPETFCKCMLATYSPIYASTMKIAQECVHICCNEYSLMQPRGWTHRGRRGPAAPPGPARCGAGRARRPRAAPRAARRRRAARPRRCPCAESP